jgi:hypothetical protein
MKRIYRAYNPLKREFIDQIFFIFCLWLFSFYILVLFEYFQVFSYFALPYISFVSIMTTFWGNKARLCLNGLSGEYNALHIIKNIPKSYKIFLNVTISHNDKSSETDLIIIGEKGVFIIEVKNHIGVITGKEQEHNWTQFKETKFGGKYINPFFNPTKQVKTHVFRLSEVLKEIHYDNWIQGVVYFVNPSAELHIQSYKTPVLSPNDSFNSFLEKFEPKKKTSKEEILIIEKALKQQIKNEYLGLKKKKN